MSIVSHNALLNQYVPTFYLKDLRDGQTIVFDARRKAFVNATGSIGSDSLRLSDLLDVSDSLDNPLLLQSGQALVYNPGTSQWEAGFIDYETIRNKPTKRKRLSKKMDEFAREIIVGAKNLKELSMRQMKATLRI
jgi:hypothetical protein